MVREAERVVDRVFRMAEEQDDKSEAAITLGVATLGGGLVLATFGATHRQADIMGLLVVAVAATANLSALHHFLDGYLGLRGPFFLRIGPSPDWIAQRVQDASWSPAQHVRSVLIAADADVRENVASMSHVVGRRRTGMRMLLASLVAYTIAGFYIVAGAILQ